MSNDFEWFTEGEEPAPDPGRRGKEWHPLIRHRIWKVLLVLAIILIPLASLSYLAIKDRADETAALTKEEILIVHGLLQDAVSRGDYDLIGTVLSNSDPAWREYQLDLIDRQLYHDRTLLRLDVDENFGDLGATRPITVDFAADLRSALVVDAQRFTFESDLEKGKAVILNRSFNYAWDDQNWVPAPLPEDAGFWGSWIREEAAKLTMIYPARDAQIVQGWLNPLNQVVENICSIAHVECPVDLNLELQFERDGNSIFRLGENYPYSNLFAFQSRYHLDLPAPTLVGIPIDEEGAEALYRGYAGLVATILVGNYAESFSVADDIDHLLANYDLEAPPPPPVAVPRPPSSEFFSSADLPSEDLLLLCSSSSSINLFRFRFDLAQWEIEELDDKSLLGIIPRNYGAYITPAPNHDGALLHVNNERQETWQSYWWRTDDLLLLLSDPVPYFVWPPSYHSELDQVGRFIRVLQDDGGGEIEELSTSWFDVGECLAGPCAIQSVAGYPIWSPDGNNTIVITLNKAGEQSLYRGDASAQPVEYLGSGYSPFWINEHQFGYIRPIRQGVVNGNDSAAGEEIVVVQLSDEFGMQLPVETVADTKNLEEAMAAEDIESSVEITAVIIDPFNPEKWLIVAAAPSNGDPRTSYVYELDLATKELSLILDLKPERLSMPFLTSPDSRFIGFVASNEGDSFLYMLDRSSGRRTKSSHGFPSDWSSDGRWLLFMERGEISLLNPESDEAAKFPVNISGCYSAVWTSREN